MFFELLQLIFTLWESTIDSQQLGGKIEHVLFAIPSASSVLILQEKVEHVFSSFISGIRNFMEYPHPPNVVPFLARLWMIVLCKLFSSEYSALSEFITKKYSQSLFEIVVQFYLILERDMFIDITKEGI